VLWVGVVVIATVLLRHHKASSRVRLVFLIGGVLLFGFIFGWMIKEILMTISIIETKLPFTRGEGVS